MDTSKFDELAQRMAEMIPGPARELHKGLEKNFRAALQSAFQKMELVTREEYDVQAALLSRTREKLDVLEGRVAQLEAEVAQHHGTGGNEAAAGIGAAATSIPTSAPTSI